MKSFFPSTSPLSIFLMRPRTSHDTPLHDKSRRDRESSSSSTALQPTGAREIVYRRKYHKDFVALNNISFEVKNGETLGIIGQNGEGKSTLLKILSGIVIPNFIPTWIDETGPIASYVREHSRYTHQHEEL